MIWRVLFWIYLVNAVLLINHEIDSAYWQEWVLFRLPGDITGFLLVHFPILFLILYGLVLFHQQTFAGLILSLVLSFGGLCLFDPHLLPPPGPRRVQAAYLSLDPGRQACFVADPDRDHALLAPVRSILGEDFD